MKNSVIAFLLLFLLGCVSTQKSRHPIWDEAFEGDAICGMAHEKAPPCLYIKNINIHFQGGAGIDEGLYKSSRSYLDKLVSSNREALSGLGVDINVDKFFGVLMDDIKNNNKSLEVLFFLEKNNDGKSINLIFSVFSRAEYYVSVKACSAEYQLCIEEALNGFFNGYIVGSIKKYRDES